jgi:hypothetical protein
MPGDASEDEPQVGFRIEAVQLGRADQAVDAAARSPPEFPVPLQ